MANRMIWYTKAADDPEDDHELTVMVDDISNLDKDWEADITLINLKSGGVLKSRDSMKTLRARINSDTDY